MFKNYHYMNKDINSGSQIFLAKVWGKIVGFIAIIHFPHPLVKNMKKVSRIVVLPDYQGIGVGKILLNFVGEYFHNLGFRLAITTSHPAINKSMRMPWKLVRQGRVPAIGKTGIQQFRNTTTIHRHTCTWEYVI